MIDPADLAGLPVTHDPAGWALSQMTLPPSGEPAYKIAKAWDATLVPALLALGFTGKGRHFVRDDGRMTCAVHLQPFHHGHSFAVDMAIDPARGGADGPTSVKAESAPFRARFHAAGQDIWWTYGRDRSSMEAAAAAAAAFCGRHLDDTFTSLTDHIDRGSADRDAAELGFIGLGHVDIARHRAAKGDRDGACAFALRALDYVTPGSALRTEMEQLAKR